MHLLRFQSPYDVAIFFFFIVHTSFVVSDILIYESIRHKVDQTYVENPSKAKGRKPRSPISNNMTIFRMITNHRRFIIRMTIFFEIWITDSTYSLSICEQSRVLKFCSQVDWAVEAGSKKTRGKLWIIKFVRLSGFLLYLLLLVAQSDVAIGLHTTSKAKIYSIILTCLVMDPKKKNQSKVKISIRIRKSNLTLQNFQELKALIGQQPFYVTEASDPKTEANQVASFMLCSVFTILGSILFLSLWHLLACVVEKEPTRREREEPASRAVGKDGAMEVVPWRCPAANVTGMTASAGVPVPYRRAHVARWRFWRVRRRQSSGVGSHVSGLLPCHRRYGACGFGSISSELIQFLAAIWPVRMLSNVHGIIG
jgi:hypothetical protein